MTKLVMNFYRRSTPGIDEDPDSKSGAALNPSRVRFPSTPPLPVSTM